MKGAILTVNAGSSSYKLSLHDLDHRIGMPAVAQATIEAPDCADEAHASLQPLLEWVGKAGAPPLVLAVHRVVHGGATLEGPVLLDGDVLAEIDALAPLAPIHQLRAARAIRLFQAAYPKLPQLACFDTDFHRGHDDAVNRFGLPRALHDAGIRRYGFHGINYAHVADRIATSAALAHGRVIVAHLGNGSSLCAMKNGRSVDTTMGLTALDGIPMGTRCGSLDPGVILWLMQQGHDATAIEKLLYHESGLLGVSGLSSDMRVLLQDETAPARQAVDLFVARIAREMGALSATLGGLDGLVFTGGIGENAAAIRSAVCARSAWLGVRLDQTANARNAARISSPSSYVEIRIIRADEERMLAAAGRSFVARRG